MNNKKRVHKKRRNRIDIIKCIKLLITFILVLLYVYIMIKRMYEIKTMNLNCFSFLFTTMR